jgi:hypothetical protein
MNMNRPNTLHLRTQSIRTLTRSELRVVEGGAGCYCTKTGVVAALAAPRRNKPRSQKRSTVRRPPRCHGSSLLTRCTR